MTPEQPHLVLGMATTSKPERAESAVLRSFGAADGAALGVSLLWDCLDSKDPTDVECAIIVYSWFGCPREGLQALLLILDTGWHYKHEDVVRLIAKLRSPVAIPALLRAADFVPDYLEWDEDRELARKVVWALGAIPGPEAHDALHELVHSTHGRIRDEAHHQLDRRLASPPH